MSGLRLSGLILSGIALNGKKMRGCRSEWTDDLSLVCSLAKQQIHIYYVGEIPFGVLTTSFIYPLY